MLSPLAPAGVAGYPPLLFVAPRLLTLLSLVILGAGAARLLGLDHLLVWHDEVFTLIRVFGYQHGEVQAALFSGQILTPADLLRFQQPDPAHTWLDTFRALAEHPEHAPLYYLLARLATALPLDPVTAVRGVSAIFGVLLIPAVYWLTRELGARGLTPWIAAALVACSPLQLLYAQEARQYALWLLLLVAASAALTRALRRETRADWWLYAVFITLGLYSHLLFALMLPVHALYALRVRFDGSNQPGQFVRLVRRWSLAVGVALLLFSPWLWVIATQPDRIGDITSWMRHPVGLDDLFASWVRHLTHTFVDLSHEPSQQPLPGSGLLLIPLAWAIWLFIRQAPRPAVWLLLLTALVYLGIVLGPDLLQGGSRSRQVRYALPTLLAVQIMVAWVIGTAIAAESGALARRLGLGVLALLLGLGGLSQLAIQRADTWPTKQFSTRNGEIARIANTANTLIIASDGAVAIGEAISLAYRLAPQIRIWGEPQNRPFMLPEGFADCIALTPSDRVQAALGSTQTLTALAGTWQWFAVSGPQADPAQTPPPAAAADTSTTPVITRPTDSPRESAHGEASQ